MVNRVSEQAARLCGSLYCVKIAVPGTVKGKVMSSSSANNDSPPGYRDEIAAFALVATVFLCMVGAICVVNKFRYREIVRRNDVRIQSDVQLVRDSLRAMFREEFARSTRELSARRLQDRKAYISSKLQTNILYIKQNEETESPQNAGLSKRHSWSNQSGQDVEIANEKENEGCAICLNEFEHGDEITNSCNTACSHKFHPDCITEWLLTHELCPCCRHAYLLTDEQVGRAPRTASPDETYDNALQRGLVLFRELAQVQTVSAHVSTSGASSTSTERSSTLHFEGANAMEESNIVTGADRP